MLAIAIIMGIVFGYGFYQAVINHDAYWAIMWAIALGMWQADKMFNSPTIRGFLKGLSQ